MSAESVKTQQDKEISQEILINDIKRQLLGSDGRLKVTVLDSYEQEAVDTGIRVKTLIVFPTGKINLADTNNVVDVFNFRLTQDPRMKDMRSKHVIPTAFGYTFVGGLTLNPSSDSDNFERICVLLYPDKISADKSIKRYNDGYRQDIGVIYSEKFEENQRKAEQDKMIKPFSIFRLGLRK